MLDQILTNPAIRYGAGIVAGAIPADSVLMEALTCISLCSRNSASSKEECGKIARTALWQSKYGPERIAWELDETASGRAYYGNALRVAKDFPGITPEERGVLDAWLTGRATFDPKQNFSWPLQEIAAKLRATPADRVPGTGMVAVDRKTLEDISRRMDEQDELFAKQQRSGKISLSEAAQLMQTASHANGPTIDYSAEDAEKELNKWREYNANERRRQRDLDNENLGVDALRANQGGRDGSSS